MKKVITYGTFDLLHHGHIRLLERAKGLGDYLIVGVTSDDYDKTRGKINNQQSLMERVAAVEATGIADMVIAEEYEGQKIDDIKHYGVDIFTVGSDWVGKFDYLNEYCTVVYLDRTEGISSTELRKQHRRIRLGLVGNSLFLNKVIKESGFVNGISITAVCTANRGSLAVKDLQDALITTDFDEMLDAVDAIYLRSEPGDHYESIRKALMAGKHVLCESPLVIRSGQSRELYQLAKQKGLMLMETMKTAYATAYERMLLLVKTGKIGDVVSINSTCTSMNRFDDPDYLKYEWRGFYEWGPTAILPIFQILGCDPRDLRVVTRYSPDDPGRDIFSSVDFIFDNAVANAKVGTGAKSEGELIISGTRGYIYVPAPWWKTDYFEIRFEDQTQNKRYFYQLDGEGIRYELVSFAKSIESGFQSDNIGPKITEAISQVMEQFENSIIIGKGTL